MKNKLKEVLKKIISFMPGLVLTIVFFIQLIFIICLYLENKELKKKLLNSDNLLYTKENTIESYQIDNTELYKYETDILNYYSDRKWSNVIVASTNYQEKLKYRNSDIRPVIYLSTGYAYYSLYRNNRNNEYFINALINIDNYTNVIMTNSVAFYTKGLIYLEHGDQNTNDFDIATDSYNQSDKNFKKARSIEYKEQYDRHIKIVATRIKKLNEMHKTNK